MRENLKDLSDPDKYITQQQIVDIITGAQKGAWAIQEWLMQQVAQFESKDSGEQ